MVSRPSLSGYFSTSRWEVEVAGLGWWQRQRETERSRDLYRKDGQNFMKQVEEGDGDVGMHSFSCTMNHIFI